MLGIGRGYSVILLYLIGGFLLAGIAMWKSPNNAQWILEWLPEFALPAIGGVGAKAIEKIGRSFAERHKSQPLSGGDS